MTPALAEHELLVLRGLLGHLSLAEIGQALDKPPVWVQLVVKALRHKTGCPDLLHLESWARFHQLRPLDRSRLTPLAPAARRTRP